MRRYRRLHPGIILKRMVFNHVGIDISEVARKLGIARISLSRILNGRAGISPELSVRLEKAGISDARLWNTLQANYNLWKAKQKPISNVEHISQIALH